MTRRNVDSGREAQRRCTAVQRRAAECGEVVGAARGESGARGRRSGKLRRTALMYAEDAGRYLLVASNGGAAAHPAWYLNLVAEPEVEVQMLRERFRARARVAEGAERDRLWAVAAKGFPTYDRYLVTARKKGREIPLIVVERAP